jgi:hypothetical protein
MIRGEAPATILFGPEQPARRKKKITLIQLSIIIAHIIMSNADILHQYTFPTGAPNVF